MCTSLFFVFRHFIVLRKRTKMKRELDQPLVSSAVKHYIVRVKSSRRMSEDNSTKKSGSHPNKDVNLNLYFNNVCLNQKGSSSSAEEDAKGASVSTDAKVGIGAGAPNGVVSGAGTAAGCIMGSTMLRSTFQARILLYQRP